MVSFPWSLDTLLNPTASTLMDDVWYEHDTQHTNANDAIEALEAKVWVDWSAVATSLDYKVAQRAVGAASSTDNALVRFDSTTGKAIQNGIITQDDTGNLSSINAMNMNLTPTVGTYAKGKVYRDATNGTMAIDLGDGVTLQVGQEWHVRVRNITGSNILNGKVVYINGASSGIPTIALAKADAIDTSHVIGIATQQIDNGAYGIITIYGLVHDLDTHTYTTGQPIFLSAATAGEFTATSPSTPNISYQLWVVGTVDNTAGSVLVHLGSQLATDVTLNNGSSSVAPSQWAVKSYVDQRWVDVNRYGFVPNETTLAFNGSNTVTVTPVSSTWTYYRAGIRYTITGAKSVVIPWTPITTGKYYIYIDATDGTLSQSGTAWTLNDTKLPVATLYFNDALTPKYVFADERHQCIIDRREHMYEHYISGTKFSSGGDLAGYTVNTPTDAGNTFSIAASNIFDEDLYKTLSELADTNGTTANYKVMLRTSTTTWSWIRKDMPFQYTATAAPYTYVQYDNAGTMTDAINNRFLNYYVYMTNGIDASESVQWTSTSGSRYMIVPGRGLFTTAALAYAENPATFSFAGFPVDEAVCVWQITLDTTGVSNTVKGRCQINRVQKVASNIISSSTSTSANHDGLSGVNLAANTVTYGHIDDQTQTIAGAKTFSSDVTVPAEAYWAGWNGSNEVPTKNDTYDQIETKAPIASPTFTWTVTLPKTTEIQDTSADHQYVLGVNELTADRTVTLPLLTGNDEFTFNAHTQTLTNKRITKRVTTTTDDATAEINIDTTDVYQLSAIANATTFTVTGTPTDGQMLLIRYKDAGTAKLLTFTGFTALGVTIPTTTVISKRWYVWATYNAAATTWHVIAVGVEA